MKEYIDQKLLLTLVAFVVVLALLTWAWGKFFSNSKPMGALTQGEYDKLTETEKLSYKKVGDYYVKA